LNNRGDVHDFLQISYQGISFLVNRGQFSFSMFLEDERPVNSKLRYFDGILEYNQEQLLSFNLDSYLKDVFVCSGTHKVQLVLIAGTHLFSTRSRKIITRLTSKAKIDLSSKFLALKVANESEIQSISLQEIYPLPRRLREYEASNGVLGVRFPQTTHVQYFVDVERLVFNSILSGAKEKG